MKHFLYQIRDPQGFHARPAAQVVMEARKFACAVNIEWSGNRADAKEILELMALGAGKNTEICFFFDGPDEDAAAEAMEILLHKNQI